MGVNVNTARFLLEAKIQGVTFDNLATIGRSTLYVSTDDMIGLMSTYDVSPSKTFNNTGSSHTVADDFFGMLGAKNITSIDISNYEGANTLHDMNLPIPDDLANSFDVVYDGGSLEHVFNFPQAMKNCMEMVKVGGRMIIETMANNLMGHGFYQFCPELFYRCLCPANGFHVERMIIYEIRPNKLLFNVIDPSDAQSRVELCNGFPTFMYVQAKRDALKQCFAEYPQQSDYEICWHNGIGDSDRHVSRSTVAGKWRNTCVLKYAKCVKRALRRVYNCKYTILRSHYKRPFKRSYYKEFK